MRNLLIILSCFFVLPNAIQAQGKLFIIGGGKRPPALIQALLTESGVGETGTIAILPMASSEPDTSAFYASKQFLELGISNKAISVCNFKKGEYPQSTLELVQKANLIYLTGGDQNRLMEVVLDSPLYEILHDAYQKGATIAGTSAGAAVMSEKMITGNEYKHPEYTGYFRTIEAENLEIKEGIGFLKDAIIDQHFVYRMRMNRLITVALEYPHLTCFGIDESTAVVIQGHQVKIVGEGQVVVLSNPGRKQNIKKGLLGGEGLRLSVYLPGDIFNY